jgi:hypothetical protein
MSPVFLAQQRRPNTKTGLSSQLVTRSVRLPSLPAARARGHTPAVRRPQLRTGGGEEVAAVVRTLPERSRPSHRQHPRLPRVRESASTVRGFRASRPPRLHARHRAGRLADCLLTVTGRAPRSLGLWPWPPAGQL